MGGNWNAGVDTSGDGEESVYGGKLECRCGQLEMPVWKVMGENWNAGVDMSGDGEESVYEHHIDDHDTFLLPAYVKYCHSSFDPAGSLTCVNCEKPEREDWKCLFKHQHEDCKCHCEVIHTGQDESIYKAYQLSSRVWLVDGVCGLRKKPDGPGEMVSAFQDDVLGFGLPITAEQLVTLNAYRRRLYPSEHYDDKNKEEEYFKEDLTMSPGVRFLNYGNADGKEGYWTYVHLARQSDDVLDLYACLYPNYQIVGEYDWSSGHSKARFVLFQSLHSVLPPPSLSFDSPPFFHKGRGP